MKTRARGISRRNALRLAGIAVATAGVAKPGIIRMAFAQDKTPIKIGFPVPLSGIYGDYAKDQVNGAQLAISQFNAKGGVLGRKVELLVRDDQLDVQVNTQVAKELCENDKVDFLSGALGESTILSMNEASRQYKKIFFGINQSGDIFTGKNFNKYTFLEAMTPYLSVTYLARYAKEKWNPKRVFTIGPDYQWGHNNKTQWKRRVEGWGGQIVGEIIYPFKNEKYEAFMQPILDAKPDLLAAANFGDEQVLFLKQAVAYGIQQKMPILLDSDRAYSAATGRRRRIQRRVRRNVLLLGHWQDNSHRQGICGRVRGRLRTPAWRLWRDCIQRHYQLADGNAKGWRH